MTGTGHTVVLVDRATARGRDAFGPEAATWIAEPVRGATLIGNGADILMKISKVGRELELAPGMCGSISGSVPVNVGQPAVLVDEITVGGR